MSIVKQYFRGKEESAQTPINSPDKFGQIVGGSITDAANQVMQPLARMVQQQQNTLDESRRAKVMGEYSSDIMTGSQEIKQKYADDPQKALEELKTFRQQTRDKYLEGEGSGPLRQKLSVDFENFNTDQVLHDLAWGSQQATLLTQQNYIDRVQSDSKFISTSGNYSDYLTKAQALENDRANFRHVFGPEKGDKLVDDAQESFVKAAVYADIDNGKSFEAAQKLLGKQYDAFITPDVKRSLIEQVDKAQKGAQTQSEFLTAAKSVTNMFGSSGGVISGEMPIADLEESISQASYELNQAAANPNTSPEQLTVLKNQETMLQHLRDAKLAAISSTAVDDIDTKGSLLAQFETLIQYDEGAKRKSLKGTLVDISAFQRDATKAYYEGKISSKTYAGWMEVARAAITSDIQGKMKETKRGYDAGEGVFGMGQAKVLGKLAGNNTPDGGKIRKALGGILRNADTKSGRGVAVDTMDFFLDDLNDQTQGDLGQVKNLSDQTMADMVGRAKLKARLKSMGYSVYLTTGDQINTSAGIFTISGKDADGMPVVDISKMNLGK